MWAMPAAAPPPSRPAPATASIFSSADFSAAGLRVNCTAEASARASRRRQIAACSARPMNRPSMPAMWNIQTPMSIQKIFVRPPGLPSLSRWRLRAKPSIANRPESQATSRVFSAMSPLRMWLNSCAITACSSSRSSSRSAPRVTPIAAPSMLRPAANALMPSSRSSTQISGSGIRAASDISATMLSSWRRSGSVVSGVTRVPRRARASAPPPPRCCHAVAALNAAIISSTTSVIVQPSIEWKKALGIAPWPSSAYAAPSVAILANSTMPTASTKAAKHSAMANTTRSQNACDRARCCLWKKSVATVQPVCGRLARAGCDGQHSGQPGCVSATKSTVRPGRPA